MVSSCVYFMAEDSCNNNSQKHGCYQELMTELLVNALGRTKQDHLCPT